MLGHVLRFMVAICGSLHKLAERIETETHVTINRMTLSKITRGEDAHLTWIQIVALDQVCARAGYGFLAKPRWLEQLTRNGTVRFTIASYVRKKQQRNDVANWDVQALAEAMRDC